MIDFIEIEQPVTHVCAECGAIVHNLGVHEEWHNTFVKKEIERIISGDESEPNANPDFAIGEKFPWHTTDNRKFQTGDKVIYDSPSGLYTYDPHSEIALESGQARYVYTDAGRWRHDD